MGNYTNKEKIAHILCIGVFLNIKYLHNFAADMRVSKHYGMYQ